MDGTAAGRFSVGGVRLDRPFKIRRLSHFAINTIDVPSALTFYSQLLGFSISDELDFNRQIKDVTLREKFGDCTGYFLRHNSDHHSFILCPKPFIDHRNGPMEHDDVTINHVCWQVGSLDEVSNAVDWVRDHGHRITRAGRDMPGSGWHVYWIDPDEVTNELSYGMEQIGWTGNSKPKAFRKLAVHGKPESEPRPEYEEVAFARAEGTDLLDGYQYAPSMPPKFNVGGILLPRPFKVTRVGPMRLFVDDVDATEAYYTDQLGMTLTQTVIYEGHRCVFLRVGTEHHSVALYPRALRASLGLSVHTSSLSFGMQLGGYDQLRDAVPFLEKNGVDIKYLPPELSPGIDYSAFAIDPDGHAIQLYYYMEQVGWDGKPRPTQHNPQVPGVWPETVNAVSDTFGGEVHLGPLG